VTASAEWSARDSHSSVVTPDGSIVLIGGYDGEFKNDVWRFNTAGSSVKNPSHTYTSPGIYTVSLQVNNNLGYNSMQKTGYISVTGGINVLPLPGFSNPPTDPDGDGLYDDLNANGFADWDDAVVLFWNTDWIQDNEPVASFDFNHNGIIDWDDAVVLFWKV
jgi:PKD repeat protein